jgi:hypothetical protein
MTDLSTRAQSAIEVLQEQTASEAERARVRARLASMGIVAFTGAATAAVASSAAAASLGGSVSPAAVSAVGAAGAPLAVSTLGAGATVPAASALVGASVVSGAAGSAGATLSAAGVLAKLASLPLALKTGALVVVVAGAGAVALPDASPRPSVASVAPVTTAASAPVIAPGSAATRRGKTSDVPMRLEARTESARSGASEAARDQVPDAREDQMPPSLVHAASHDSSVPPAGDVRVKRPSTVTSAAHAKPSAAGDTSPASNSTLAAESSLLSSALRALRAGHYGQAAQLLDQHERTFGTHAQLARERERMRDELSQTLR